MEENSNLICPLCEKEIINEENSIAFLEFGKTYHKRCWDRSINDSSIIGERENSDYLNCGEEVSKDNQFCPQYGKTQSNDINKFCGECGIELNPGDAFCYNCGAKVASSNSTYDSSSSDNNPNNEKTKTIEVSDEKIKTYKANEEFKKSGTKKATGIVAIALIVVIGIFVSILSSGSSNNKYISFVKNGHPTSYPNLTYGKAFDNFFASPTWKYFKSNTREDVVEFTGYCTYQNVKVKADLQFILNEDAGTFTVGAVSFNDVPQVNLMTAALISKIFESQ